MMNKLITITATALTFAMTSAASAQVACNTGSLAQYALLGGTGCQVGGIVFSNFHLGDGTDTDPSAWLVSPTLATIGGRTWAGFTLSSSNPFLLRSEDAVATDNQGLSASRRASFLYDMRSAIGITGVISFTNNSVAFTSAPDDPQNVPAAFWYSTVGSGAVINDNAWFAEAESTISSVLGSPFSEHQACDNLGCRFMDAPYTLGTPAFFLASGMLTVNGEVFASDNGFNPVNDTPPGSATAGLESVTALYEVSDSPEPSALALIALPLLVSVGRSAQRRRRLFP